MNFQMFKLDFEKANETVIKLPRIIGSLKKDKSSRKTSPSALLSTPKPLTVKSSGPLEASLQPKLVKVMEFQLSYFKS